MPVRKAQVNKEMAEDESGRFAIKPVEDPKMVIIDYGGANVAKPLHVGHLRAAIIGECLKRLSRFLGHQTLGDVHLGDWGLQMGQIIVEMQARDPELVYFDPNYTGSYPSESPVTIDDLAEIYPIASQKSKSDPEIRALAQQATTELQEGRPGYMALWKHFLDVSVADLKKNYGSLDVFFDLWLGESDVQSFIPPIVEDLTERGVAIKSDGALVVPVAEEHDKKELSPMMLVKSNGSVGYEATDLATIYQRVKDYNPDLIVYVVDSRQQEHFRKVFRAAYRSGIADIEKLEMEHAYFGTMNGTDGKPFKTRAGDVMRLEDLLGLMLKAARSKLAEISSDAGYTPEEEYEIARNVGIAALKFGDLINHRTGNYIFDIERFTSFEGRTGPYLLYAVVRTNSILEKAAEKGLVPGEILPAAGPEERDLQLKLLELPDLLNFAFDQRAPNHISDYTYNLAIAFNRFYAAHHILNEENAAQQASWLRLAKLNVDVLTALLDMMGIGVPSRM
ncbi:MAG: arginine--tRNA ligase [Chloroflexota bacterium]